MATRLRFVIMLTLCDFALRGAQAMTLQLDRVNNTTGSFGFRLKATSELQDLPINARDETFQAASTDHYQIWTEWNETSQIKYSQLFRYFIYAQPKSGGPITVFTFVGEPTGSFEDQIANVEFSIGEPPERSSIDLPIFGSSNPKPLIGASFTQPVELYLVKRTPYFFTAPQ